jgi:hypothetical protein
VPNVPGNLLVRASLDKASVRDICVTQVDMTERVGHEVASFAFDHTINLERRTGVWPARTAASSAPVRFAVSSSRMR